MHNKIQNLKKFLPAFYIGLCCIFFATLALLLWWMDRWALGVEFWAYMNWKNLIANALPMLVLTIFLTAISRRAIWSLMVISGASCLLYVASKIKFQTLGQTVVLQDYYFIKSLNATSIQLLLPYVEGISTSVIVIFSVFLLLLTAAFFAEGKLSSLSKRTRFACGTVAIAGFFSILAPAWPTSAIYTRSLLRPEVGFFPIAVLRGGLISSIIYRHVELSQIDLNFDKNEIYSKIGDLQKSDLWLPSEVGLTQDTKQDALPDIIFVLSESFMDPYVISGMDSYPDIIPNFRRIASQSDSGYMKAPAYGGGTVRTEFEVLTGMPMSAFPEVEYPYPDLPQKELPGLASFLVEKGYHTFAIHAHHWRFWDRNIAYPRMKILELKSDDLFKQTGHKDGRWYSDESMTDVLLGQLPADAPFPVLAVAISLQAHGPYTGGREMLHNPHTYDSLVLPPLSEQADKTLRTYFYHIHEADRQLGRLVDALEARGRPYRLLFFGDHLPALPQVWSELGFTDGQSADKQKVPWLIAGSSHSERSDCIGYSWQLPSALLESIPAIGSAGDEYLAFSSAIGRESCRSDRDMALLPNDPALLAAARANVTGAWRRYVQK